MVKRIPRTQPPTFSQAQGIDPLPQPLKLGQLPTPIRNLLWSWIYDDLRSHHREDMFGNWSLGGNWPRILCDYHVDFLYRPLDEFTEKFEPNASDAKNLIQTQPYNRVFDYLQFLMRHRSAPQGLSKFISSAFKKFMCAYTVIDDGPTIAPVSLPEQAESITRSFQTLSGKIFQGARRHLIESAQLINAGKPAASVRESIHAVESVARRLDADASTTLKPALDALSNKNVELHPAFKKGVESLYGYTSDEDGIRHAQLGDDASVDMEDAVFMFGACAAFSAYLVDKARKAGLL